MEDRGKRKEYLTLDEYFMAMARIDALRSKDPSTQVGACIVNKENRIISNGYNGLPNGMDDDLFYWDSRGEETGDIYLIKNTWVVHAERNAILNCHGQDLTGTRMYVTLFPCRECAKSIIQAGIKKVIYLRSYKDKNEVDIVKTMFQYAGVECVPYNQDKDFTKEEIQEVDFGIQKMLKRFS